MPSPLGDLGDIVAVLPGTVCAPVADVAVASATFSDVAGTPVTGIAVYWTSSAAAYCELPWKDPSVHVLRVGKDIAKYFFQKG